MKNLIIVEGEGSSVFDGLMASRILKPDQIFIIGEYRKVSHGNKLHHSLVYLYKKKVISKDLADSCEEFQARPDPWDVSQVLEKMKGLISEEDTNFLLISNNLNPLFQLAFVSSLGNISWNMVKWDRTLQVVEGNHLYTKELESSREDLEFAGYALKESLESLKGPNLPRLKPGEISFHKEEGKYSSFHIPILKGRLEIRGWVGSNRKLMTEVVVTVDEEGEDEYARSYQQAKVIRFLMGSLGVYCP